MAKWEDRPNCPACKGKHTVEGTLAHGRCEACGWVAIEPDKHRALDAEAIGNMQYPERKAPKGCPGCGGQVRVLPKNDRDKLGMRACCDDCGREPIEYIALQAMMSDRDQMAAAALTKLSAWEDGEVATDGGFEKRDVLVAKRCYAIADAMLAEREKEKQ